MDKLNLINKIDELEKAKILVIGDFALDEMIYGATERISREAPVLILEHYETKKLLGNHKIINIDSNIIAQKPKLAPYINSMRERISCALNIDITCISIKAKTNENVDSVGEGISIAANAVVLID